MRDLYKEIENFTQHSLTPLGRRSIDAFRVLPAGQCWAPTSFLGLEIATIFDTGLPLALINDSENSAEIIAILSTNLNGAPQLHDTAYQSTVAELHACALLNAQGFPAKFVPRADHRTPDLRIHTDQMRVDIEVARGSRKSQHEEARKHLQDFVGGIQPGDLDHNIAFFFADINNPTHRNHAFDAAMTLVVGSTATDNKNWSVVAVCSSVGNDFPSELATLQPSWWPKVSASFVVSAVRTGVQPTYVYIKCLPPRTDYINPLRRKAEKFQGTAGMPFLIALECSELPNVFEQIEGEVAPYWPLWHHVSGILVFEPRFWTVGTHKSYVWKLLRNPHAKNPLPSVFPDTTAEKQQIDLHVLEPVA
jgi:hypothetical protein